MNDEKYPWHDVPAGVPCWHIHHCDLLEWSTEPLVVRAKFIRDHKSDDEIETRLERMRPAKGELPKAVVKAKAARDKARDTFFKARDTYDKTRDTCYKAQDIYHKALETYDQAWFACNKVLSECAYELNALHASECPDCPWDGKTLFPKETT